MATTYSYTHAHIYSRWQNFAIVYKIYVATWHYGLSGLVAYFVVKLIPMQ